MQIAFISHFVCIDVLFRFQIKRQYSYTTLLVRLMYLYLYVAPLYTRMESLGHVPGLYTYIRAANSVNMSRTNYPLTYTDTGITLSVGEGGGALNPQVSKALVHTPTSGC